MLAVAVMVVFTSAACGDDKGVGDESLLDIDVQDSKNRLGETTTTVPPSTVAPAPGKVGVGVSSTTVTTRPNTTTTVATFDVAITSDRSGTTQFDPRSARVFAGTVVRWINKDTVARSVQADGGEFASPPIPPGQSWTYRATAAGQFNYHDGTRPYAVATLEVAKK